MRIKENKVNRIMVEFARLGRVCDVVRVTGYSRSLVSAVVNGRFEIIESPEELPCRNSCDIDLYPDPDVQNFEDFGSLQYIIDKMPPDERRVVTEYFVHETPKCKIAKMINHSTSVVDRILRNLDKYRDNDYF